MRRLIATLGLCLVVSACKPREKIKLEPTEEGAGSLLTFIHMADPRASAQLVRGFHQLEQNSWRWTMGKFAVVLKSPTDAARNGATLAARFSVPDAVLQRLQRVMLTATIEGRVLGSATYTAPGEAEFKAVVPPAEFKADAVTIDFTLDRFLPAGTADARELGLIVTGIGFEQPGR